MAAYDNASTSGKPAESQVVCASESPARGDSAFKFDHLLPGKTLYILAFVFAALSLATPFTAGKLWHFLTRAQPFIAFVIFSVTAYSLGRDRALVSTFIKSKSWLVNFSSSDLLRTVTNLCKVGRANPLLTKVIGCMAISMAIGFAEDFFIQMFNGGGLLWTLTYATGLSLLAPLSSVLALTLAKRLSPRRLPAAERLLPRLQHKLASAVRSFLVYRYPYLSAYSAYLMFCAIVSFAPLGVGSAVASWLQASAIDANIARPEDSYNQLTLLAQSGMFLSLSGALRQLAIRLSASFQILLSRLFINKDTLLEALIETANVRSTKLALPESHPHITGIIGTLTFIIICYAVLFCLVAFCPPPFQTSIPSWLNACVADANISVDLNQHLNLRIFLASVIAGCGAVPVAVGACAFLPSKKAKSLLISSQGILCPSSFLGLWPLKSWVDLKSVSVKNFGKAKKEVLRLSFSFGGTINLSTSKCKKEELVELLTAADEYAVSCKFEPQVLALRLQLLEETKAKTITEANKFSATIFSPLNTGDKINDGSYRVVRKLAGKSLSAVYLARDQADELVVIKQFVLPSSALQSQALCHLFEREYKILSALRHEGLAAVIGVFEENGARYIVMEHIRGHDLRSVVQRHGARSEKVVLRWGRDIAGLMQIMHAQEPSILHRDLTPDNIMEDEDGKIKLIDFGAAHQLMEGVTGTLIGKQCYIAPEQLRGKASIASDIYSFGCTLYFLLTGKDPAALKQSDPAMEDANISPVLVNLVRKCTEFDEKDRYSSFEQIIADFDSANSVTVKLRQHVVLEGEKA